MSLGKILQARLRGGGGGDVSQTASFINEVLADGEGFRFAKGCPRTLLATCFAVCTLELLGCLDALPLARREQLGRFIKSCQAPHTGLFRDPLHADSMLFTLQKFTPLYLEWQESYFALHALDALQLKADHPLSFVEPFRDRRVLDMWLRTLRFDDFWFASNYLMFLLLFLVLEDGKASSAAHQLLDRLDERQDPETGFWGTQQGASLFNGMAGAFHIYGFCRYLGRPIAHQTQAVRATLSLQEKSGMYGGPGGGPCEDLDAVDILAKLEPDPSDEKAVRAALKRVLSGLEASRQADGSYRWLSPQGAVKRQKVTYSGLTTMSTPSDAGDAWSGWFRPLAIALARQRLGQEPAWNVRYRRLPLLGWHPQP